MVLVFGSINADLVASVPTLPREGETQTASGFAVHPGGKGANQALAARRITRPPRATGPEAASGPAQPVVP